MNKDSRTQQTPRMYDGIYSGGGYGEIYQLPYRRSHYFPLFKTVLNELKRRKVNQVLEVGCGVGTFAHMLFDNTALGYHGFDFSEVAVTKAKEMTGRHSAFSVQDAINPSSYRQSHDVLVCTEVLEHIPEDMETIANWPVGSQFVCSVPNFDASNHERFFRHESEIRQRYGDNLDIERIVRIRRPVITDIGIRNRLRQLRWAREHPKQFIKVLGFSSFDEDGGWFLFSGRCR